MSFSGKTFLKKVFPEPLSKNFNQKKDIKSGRRGKKLGTLNVLIF